MKDNGLLSLQDIQVMSAEAKSCLPSYTPGYLWASQIETDQEYQRELDKSRVGKIQKYYDSIQVNPIKVNWRNGKWCAFDGQHTMDALRRMNGEKDFLVFVLATVDMSFEQEATVFAEQATFKKAISCFDQFKARYLAGSEKEKMISALLAKHQLRLVKSSKGDMSHSIQAVNALKDAVDKYGYEVLDQTLDIIAKTWEYDGTSWRRVFILGISSIVAIYDDFDPDYAISKWGKWSTQSYIRRTHEKDKASNAMARVLVEEYNTRIGKARTKLDISKLMAK